MRTAGGCVLPACGSLLVLAEVEANSVSSSGGELRLVLPGDEEERGGDCQEEVAGGEAEAGQGVRAGPEREAGPAAEG